ncbi:MAG: RDD family protein [bacterium]
MKCPECGYISFDHLKTCQKCGAKIHKDPEPNLDFSPEDNNTSGESSPEYPRSESSSDKGLPEKNIEIEKDPVVPSNISQVSSEKDENPPKIPFLSDGPEKDDTHSSEYKPLSENTFLSSEPKEETQFNQIKKDENILLPSEKNEGIQADEIKTDINKSKGGFWIRTLAFIIDLIFINILIRIFAWTIKLGVITGARIMLAKPETFFDLREFLITAIGIAIIVFYFVYFHGRTGQTPGKRLLHLKVIRTDGSPLGLDKAIERFFCYIISLLPLYIGFIFIAFNKDKQGLHDIIAHTYVIKTG